jgi:uncharacterized glyoxalase superfamily protein PhnB
VSHFRTITPVLRYRDPSAAAEWLCRALGFGKDRIVEDPQGGAAYVSLRLGDCSILLCPVVDSALTGLVIEPAEVGGANTQICYVMVQDLDGHSERARAAGAKIELGPHDDGAGGRYYMCRDPEGYLWSFGTQEDSGGQQVARRSNLAKGLVSVTAVLLVAAGLVFYAANYRTMSPTLEAAARSAQSATDSFRETVADELARRIQAEMVASEVSQKLEQERLSSAGVRQELQRAQADISQMRLASEQMDRAQRVKGANDGNATALALERTRANAALEERDALKAKAEELVSAALAERQQRLKAEREVTSAREQLARLQQPNDSEQAFIATAPSRQEEPEQPDDIASAEPPALPQEDAKTARIAKSVCALAVQGKIPLGAKGTKSWDATSLARLCRNAENSQEPAKCFDQLMRRQINWGGSTTWMASNALLLCSSTLSASQTLDCFVKTVAADNAWRSAIDRCRHKL